MAEAASCSVTSIASLSWRSVLDIFLCAWDFSIMMVTESCEVLNLPTTSLHERPSELWSIYLRGNLFGEPDWFCLVGRKTAVFMFFLQNNVYMSGYILFSLTHKNKIVRSSSDFTIVNWATVVRSTRQRAMHQTDVRLLCDLWGLKPLCLAGSKGRHFVSFVLLRLSAPLLWY